MSRSKKASNKKRSRRQTTHQLGPIDIGPILPGDTPGSDRYDWIIGEDRPSLPISNPNVPGVTIPSISIPDFPGTSVIINPTVPFEPIQKKPKKRSG